MPTIQELEKRAKFWKEEAEEAEAKKDWHWAESCYRIYLNTLERIKALKGE